jgi:non-heme Fe2+,alpha-ketoglutarate-dependent halogenase
MSGLSAEQVARFHRDGCVFPVTVFEPDEVRRFRAAFDAYSDAYHRESRTTPPKSREDWLVFPHLRHRWAYDVVTHPRVVDAVESILGPDVMVWDAKLFPKPPRSTAYVSWHQDATYMPMGPLEHVVTAWIALSDSTAENGAMQFLPGTHVEGQKAHAKTFAERNLLSYGQEIEAEIDPSRIVDVVLAPGQMSLHHLHLVHGSPANPSDRPRIGISVNYLSPDVVDRAEIPRPARLLRGRDAYGHFASFEAPAA